MAKGEAPGNQAATRGRIREYSGPLGVLASGTLGMVLLCIISVFALESPKAPTNVDIEPKNIVDLAVSNLNTVSALTMQAVTGFIPTSTITPTLTPQFTDTSLLVSNTPRFVTVTPTLPRRTRAPLPTATRTALAPTKTPAEHPTTSPTITYTPITPTLADTPITPTIITDTPIPPYPTDTATELPPATTEIPSDTPTDPPTIAADPPSETPTP
jgi:hypothetical protein